LDLAAALNVIQIIIAVALMIFILIQAKGSGLSGVFGGDGAIYRTRRGLEKTLFNVTLYISIAFFTVALLSVVKRDWLHLGGVVVAGVLIAGLVTYFSLQRGR